MSGENLQPTTQEKAVSPATPVVEKIDDLSASLNKKSGKNIKRLAGITGLTAALAFAGSAGIKPAFGAEDESYEPISQPNTGAEIEIYNPSAQIEEDQQDTENPAPTYPDSDDLYPEDYVFLFDKPTMKFKDHVFNQNEKQIEDVTYEDLEAGVTDFYEKNGDKISCFNYPFYSAEDIPEILEVLRDGSDYSQELAAEESTPKKAQRKIDGSRLVMAGDLMSDFFLMHDNTGDEQLRLDVEAVTDLTADYIATSVKTNGGKKDKKNYTNGAIKWIDGAIEYNLRNYRYKIGEPITQSCELPQEPQNA